jgi:hypothetical protein
VRIAIRASARLLAAAVLALSSASHASALESAGVIPEAYFSEEGPSAAVETVNDSTGACVDRVETDDRRSFGLRAYASYRDLAFAVACDGFTFRGSGTDPGSRSDELSVTAAWMGKAWGDGFFRLRPGGGIGLRAWGDFGFMAIQQLWHDVLGVSREFPTAFNESTLRPFAYASLDLLLGQGNPFGGEVSMRDLALGSGAIESSIALLGRYSSGRSESWAGLSWQGRLGSFDENDALANEYEEGLWIVTGARTGPLSTESSVDLRTNFAIGTIALSFGSPRPEGPGTGPRQELGVGTSFLESELATSRFIALPLRGGIELRVGIEAVEGVSRWLWSDLGYPQFQEASVAVEAFPPDRGRVWAFRPFAGAALGARQDTLSVSELQRSELFNRVSGFLFKAYAGLRLLEIPVSSDGLERIGLDICAGLSAMSGWYHPAEVELLVRINVRD